MLYFILNTLKEYIDWLFEVEDGIKNIFLVSNDKRNELTVNELTQSYDHVEFEFVLNQQTYIHVLPGFHRSHKNPPVILSAILNDSLDITKHVNKYLMNDLTYLKIKYIIPPQYLTTFESLEILDNDCNSFIYRNPESTLAFLETSLKTRRNSCDI